MTARARRVVVECVGKLEEECALMKEAGPSTAEDLKGKINEKVGD